MTKTVTIRQTDRQTDRQEQHMQEYVSRELLAPGNDGWHINGKRKYARVFIKLL